MPILSYRLLAAPRVPFYEGFVSMETDQILADQILDYLSLKAKARKQTSSWNFKKFLVL